MPGAVEKKIQIPIGVTNMAGDDLNATLQEDVAVLSPLFEQVIVTAPGQISRAPILFVYAHFNEDGFFRGLGPRGVRQIVEATQARLVVVAHQYRERPSRRLLALRGPRPLISFLR